ncbi:MAG: RHS repeat-associated core domain-containing protein [Pirellulaceae bacterium]|nr:RHS repeat-associated core domain-containing protein [Pirellulaceae bacterium]
MVSSLKTPETFAHDPRLFSGGRHRFYSFRGPIGSNNTASLESLDNKPSAWNRSDSNQNQAWNLSLVGDWNTFNQTGSSPLTQTRTHGPAHEFTSFTGTNSGTLTYDAKGNQTVRPASLVAPALNLSWDFDNRLKGADTDGNPATLEVTYEFDALGRRVARNGPSGNVVYVQSGQRTIADYARGAAATNPTYRYVYGDYIDEPILRHTGTASTLPTTGNNALYYHRNQQYSIVGLTNAAGTLVERYAYTAHGELTIMAANGTLRTTSLYNNRYTYTGREWDPDLNLYHFRARLYDPIAGRFITRDPKKYVDGKSLYRMHFSLNKKDYTGMAVMRRQDQGHPDAEYVGPFDHKSSGVKKCVFYADGVEDPKYGSTTIYETYDDAHTFPKEENPIFLPDNKTVKGYVVHQSLNKPEQIAKFIEVTGCCEIVIFGHQGGYANPGGVAANGTSPLPGTPESRSAIRIALEKHCQKCDVFIYSCGDTHWTDRPKKGETGYEKYRDFQNNREANRWTIANDLGCNVYGLRRLQARESFGNYGNPEKYGRAGWYLDQGERTIFPWKYREL